MTQLVNSLGGVEDISYLENSADPSQRAAAQVKIAMDTWARNAGFGSYDVPQGAPLSVVNQYIQAHLTFYDQAQRSLGLPTRTEQVVTATMLSSGDLVKNADGSYSLSAAAAADRALGIGPGYVNDPSGSIDAAEARATVDKLLSAALIPAGVGAIVSTILADNPDVAARLTPPPSAGGSGASVSYTTSAPAPVASVDLVPVAPSPVVGSVTAPVIGDEQRTRRLLAYGAVVALLVYLWQS